MSGAGHRARHVKGGVPGPAVGAKTRVHPRTLRGWTGRDYLMTRGSPVSAPDGSSPKDFR